ncbi:unnamed protein product, partial [Eruca vesicaria subsp. sativa]|nr:unnamed protein product [Eruca vesicaria subsp. sativa]
YLFAGFQRLIRSKIQLDKGTETTWTQGEMLPSSQMPWESISETIPQGYSPISWWNLFFSVVRYFSLKLLEVAVWRLLFFLKL